MLQNYKSGTPECRNISVGRHAISIVFLRSKTKNPQSL